MSDPRSDPNTTRFNEPPPHVYEKASSYTRPTAASRAAQAEVLSLDEARQQSIPKAGQRRSGDHSWGEDAFETPGYDEARFYTATSYGDSGSSSLHFSLASQIMYRIEALIQSGKIPQYQTKGDLARDAIYHRLKFLADHHDLGPDVARMLSLMSLEHALREDKQRVDSMKRIVKEADEAVESAAADRDVESLERFLANSERRTASFTRTSC